jgi:hypothetical protein
MGAATKYAVYVKRLPKKWNKEGKRVFREVYEMTRVNQSILAHPQAERMTPRMWDTICWNFAWLAADAVQGFTNVPESD